MSHGAGDEYHDVQRLFYGRNSTDYSYNTGQDEYVVTPVQYCLMGSILFAALYCCLRPSVPGSEHHRYGPDGRLHRRRPERKKDPEERKKIIDASLFTKRVIACDQNLNLTLGEPICGGDQSHDDNFRRVLSEDYSESDCEDDDAAACVICLETFRVGDNVTWASRNDECLHVFHEDCIMPWLENPKHDDCPSCRCRIIPEDGHFEYDSDEQQPHGIAFSIMNGLISRVRRTSASYSILGDTSNDAGRQHLDNLDHESKLTLPMSLRRVFSDVSPERRSSYPYRRRSMERNKTHRGVSPPIPPPPLCIRRVRSVDPELGESQFVIESGKAPANLVEPVPLRRISSSGLRRSNCLKSAASTESMGSTVPGLPRPPKIGGRATSVPTSIPLRRSSSVKGGALTRASCEGLPGAIQLRRTSSSSGRSLSITASSSSDYEVAIGGGGHNFLPHSRRRSSRYIQISRSESTEDSDIERVLSQGR